ncbi:hypothetical protein [Blastococcus sp. SYSU D01042]
MTLTSGAWDAPIVRALDGGAGEADPPAVVLAAPLPLQVDVGGRHRGHARRVEVVEHLPAAPVLVAGAAHDHAPT